MLEQDDLVLLGGMRARMREAEAQREAAQQDRGERLAQQPLVPRRRHDIDVGEREPQVLETGREAEPREFLGLLAAIEALLLEHQLGLARLQEGNAAVVGLGCDPEYSQGASTAMVRSDATAC